MTLGLWLFRAILIRSINTVRTRLLGIIYVRDVEHSKWRRRAKAAPRFSSGFIWSWSRVLGENYDRLPVGETVRLSAFDAFIVRSKGEPLPDELPAEINP